MMMVVELALESMYHVVYLLESSRLQCLTRIDRAVAAAAYQHHRTLHRVSRQSFNLANEMRIQLPFRPVLPGNVHGADRVADKKVFCVAAAIDKERIGVLVDKGLGLFWF